MGIPASLLQDFMHDTAFDVGQAEIAPAVAVRETGMVEAALMQQRGVQIMEVADVFHRVDAKFICGPVRCPALYSSASDEYRKAFRMMIATVRSRSMWRPSKFASP